MRSFALWTLGAAAAFLATAGAFLLLANSGGSAADGPISRAEPSEPALALSFPEDRLEDLQRRPGQKVALDVENAGNEELANVNLMLDVTSEDTARPHERLYQESVENLPPASSVTVEFEIDLSSPPLPDGNPAAEQDREILEARATTPEGVSTVKTAVVAP